MLGLLFSFFFQFQLIEGDFASLQSFKAEFEQIFSYTGNKEQIREKGVVYFKRPSLFRWEYKEPERKIFILKGNEILTFLPDEGLIQKEKITNEMMDIFSILTEGKIFEYFEIKERNCLPLKCAILFPKQTRDFNSIEIRYSKEGLKEIIIKFDSSENRIILRKFLKNIKVSSKIFTIEDL